MSERWSDESIKMLDEWAQADALARARQNREVAPASNEDIDETLAERKAAQTVFKALETTDGSVEVEVLDESLDQETVDRLTRYAQNILADGEVIVQYENAPQPEKRQYPTEATPVEDTPASSERGLYKNLTIRDRADSRAQSHKIGGIASWLRRHF